MQMIVYLIQHEGEPIPAGQHLDDYIPFLDKLGKEPIEQIPAPRTIKTHFPPYIFPLSNSAKYIYVVRNPKDSCVSKYFHCVRFDMYEFQNGKFDDFFDIFLEGKVEDNDYFDHLLSWNKHLEDENVLFVTYEEMKKDLKSVVLKVAKFLGPEHEQKMLYDQTLLQKIVDGASLNSMKRMDSEKQLVFAERPKNLPFIRNEQTGDWKNYFSPKQSQLMDEKFKQRTKDTIFENLWQDIM
eukprot:TRINITY_DN1696_c1_g1_i3.p2 TRINITY_DN1696_c1_g1~~TRINITY_DN1696_c1_g1_i3.p2  ORF type:complete len:239 (-),score=41.20 TRINITY_DN1696_c1_g1_i3:40-756(-)